MAVCAGLKSQVIIPSGPHRGRQAIIIEPEEVEEQKVAAKRHGRFEFLKLPTELRLKIYQMLYEDSDTIVLRSEQPPTFSIIPSRFFSRTNLAIAAVCRQVRFEVLPIIYGERTFQIDSPHVPDLVVDQFLAHIGDLRKHLRFLKVGRYANSHWSRPDMFNRFLACPNLRHIHFHVHAICKTPEEYAQFFYKSARLWLNVVSSRGGKEYSALDMVSFSNLPDCWPGGDWNDNGGSRLRAIIRVVMDEESFR
ncbi:MAG: hypothetical protein Q9157_005158 [Trypethelium eluteriae]